MFIGVWRVFLGPFGINVSIVLLGVFVLALAMVKMGSGKETRLFEVACMLFAIGFLYFTLHGRLLQLPFPVAVPERPLVDNNLTLNYTSTCLLTFLIFPLLLLVAMKEKVSSNSLGLRVSNTKRTILYTVLGSVFTATLFLLSNALFGFDWISEYTIDGLVLWVLLVSFVSVFAQVFCFAGLLFNRNLDYENGFLLAAISILAFQMFIASSIPWAVSNMVGSMAKIAVTWKTRNIYGAASMSSITNLLDICVQIA